MKRFLKEIGSDYVDIVLLHCLTQHDWTARYPDAMEALAECKEQGLIRAHGVSCHDYGAFQTAAMTKWVEVVLARINYAGVSMDASPADVIRTMEQMAAFGKGIYGMKVFGEGKLAKQDGSKTGHRIRDGIALCACHDNRDGESARGGGERRDCG